MKYYVIADTCVCCGKSVCEGVQICPECQQTWENPPHLHARENMSFKKRKHGLPIDRRGLSRQSSTPISSFSEGDDEIEYGK